MADGTTQVDEITIKITADATGVDEGVDSAIGSVNRLKEFVDKNNPFEGLDGFSQGAAASFESIAESAGKLSTSAESIRGVGEAISGIAKSMESIQGIDPEQASGLGESIGAIGESLSSFADVDADKLTKTANALSKLPKAVSDFGGIGDGNVADLKNTLDGIATATARAAQNGTGIGNLGRGIRAIKKGMDEFSTGIPSGSVAQLGNAVSGIVNALSGLENLGSVATSVSNLASGVRGIRNALAGFEDGTTSVQAENFKTTVGVLNGALEGLDNITGGGESVLALGKGLREIHNGLRLFSNDDYSSNIENLEGVLGRLNTAMEGFAKGGGESTTKSIQAIGRGLNSFAGAVNKLDGSGDKLNGVARDLANFAKVAQGNLTDKQLNKFERLANALDRVTEACRHLGAAEKAAGSESKRKQKTPTDFWDQFGGQVLETVANGMGKLANLMQRAAAKGWGALANGAKKYISLMGQVVRFPLDSIKGKLDSIRGSMDGLAGVIGRIVMYRALRAVLSQFVDGFNTGLQNLYQWALLTGNTFANTMDSMATSMQYFQNSVGGAASELLDALAPALETVVNWVVTALNALNQLLAALTGHGVWRKAVRSQKSFAAATNGAAGSTKKATAAEKEYEATVLGFDELNKMNKPDKSGSSGGGGGGGGGASVPDYGSMFEEAPIDDFYKQLANTDDWTALGKKIASGLNSWERQIDWDSIDKTAAKWSKRIWTAFNGFVHARDWSLFGYTVARGLNVGLHFVDDIAQNADFTAFGAGLAGALNRAVETIDWVALGHVMTDKLKVSLETLHGFLYGDSAYEGIDFGKLREKLNLAIDSAFSNIDWNTAITDVTTGLAQVAFTFVSGMNGVISNIDSVVQNYDWVAWGAEVGAFLDSAVQTIDWTAVGQFLTDGLKMAFEGLHGALQVFDWTALGNGIEEAITGAFNNIDWAQAGMDANALANKLLDVIEQAFASINWDDVDTFITNLNIPQLLSRAIGDIASGAWTVFQNLFNTNVWPLVLGFITLKMAAVGLKIVAEILKWNLMGQALLTGMNGGAGLGQGMLQGFTSLPLATKLSTWIAEHLGAGGTVTAAGAAGSAIGLGLVGGIGMAANISSVQDQVQNGFNVGNFLGTIGSAAATGAAIGAAFGGPVGAGIGAGIGAIVGGVETIVANWGSISDFIMNTIVPGFQDAFGAIGQALSDAVSWVEEHIPQPIKDVFSGIVDFFTDTFSPVPAEAEELGSDTGNGLSDGMDGKQQDVSDSATSLADLIRQGIDGATSQASTWGGDVSQSLSNGISGMAGWVSNAAGGVASRIQNGVSGAVNNAWSWGGSVSSYVANGVSGMAGRVSDAAWGVTNSMTDIIGSMWRSAVYWGSDVATSVANGLWNGVRTVARAAGDVAQTIRNFLHFSEPDIGPLADFHTYMPDMMRAMAEGIDKNSYLVTDSVQNLTRGMSLSVGASLDMGDVPSADDVISSAVERGMVSVVMGQSSNQSDRQTTIVLRVDSEDLARAVARGRDRLDQRNPLSIEFS
ncbi:hypothetical protein DXD59_00510 [Olsenella sp. TM06-36]|nr:hypothetical protein DXD59_00510 [Olsenella sp. TM06-36]